MSKSIELRQKANEALRSAQALMLKDDVTSEDLAKAKSICAEADTLEERAAVIERAEKNDAELRSLPRPNPGETVSVTAEQRTAKQKETFRNWLMHEVPGFEKRDITTATTAINPQGFDTQLMEAKKAWGGVVNLVTARRTDNGNPVKFALSNDTANGLILPGEQGATLSEVDVPFTSQMSQVDEVSTGIIKISWAELEDSYFDLDALVRDRFGKRYARGLAQYVTNGNGSNVASLKTGAATGATSASGVAISYVDLKNVYAALDPAYEGNASWTMNSTTRAYLMGIEDTLGRPIFIPNPSSGAFDQLFGRPVVLNQYLDSIAVNKVCVQYGDYSEGYRLREVGDLKLIRLNERYAEQLSSGFIGYTRVGGNVTDAGLHPVISLLQAAS